MESVADEALQPLPPSKRESLAAATTAYHAGLTRAGATYLARRGITRETAEDFRFGIVDSPHAGHERCRGWLSIPYLGHDGRTLAIRFRCLEEHDHRANGHGKYYGLPGEPTRIYNIRAVHQAQDVIAIAEGELDCAILNQIGIPAVAIPGAQAWKPHYRKVFAGFDKVFVFGDPDEAGGELVNKITSSLRQAWPVRLELGDVTETYLSEGKDALLALIETEGD